MIRNQARQGGVTVHLMDQHFDTGPVLLQQSLSIEADFTYGMLVSQLAFTGLHLCSQLLQGLAAGSLQPIPQDHQSAGWYRRPEAADLLVNWEQMPASAIRALVLACNPWNKGACTYYNNWGFGLTDVTVVDAAPNGDQQTHLPGTVVSMDEQNGLLVSCLHNQLLRINVIYCEEGFFPGYKLSTFGIRPGFRLGHYTMPAHSFQPPSPATLHQST